MTILAKPGATYDSRASDQKLCADVARRAPLGDLPASDTPLGMATGAGGGVGAVAGAAIAGLIIALIEISRGRDKAEEFCLRNLGYVALPLTPEEAAAYKKLPSPARKDWETRFLASDFAARYQPWVTPAVPPLPAYRAEPMSQGGLKIDAESLTAANGETAEGGDIVTGKASRWRTAVLATPIETKLGPIRIAADPGTVFHQVDYRPQHEHLLRVDSATWCGPVRQLANGNVAKDFYCFTGRDNAYEIYRPTGQTWFAGPYGNGFILPVYDQPIRLEERAADDLGVLAFAISVTAIHRRSVDLAAYVRHDGKQVLVWGRSLDFDAQGQTMLPLWSLRLKLSHGAQGGITAVLDHDGDGTSWRDGG